MISRIFKKIKSKYIKEGIWYLSGELIIKLLSFISLAIFARLIKVEDFGLFSVYSGIVFIASTFVGLGISGSVGPAKCEFENDFQKFVSSSLFLGVVIFPSILVLIILFADLLSEMISLKRFFFILAFIQGFQNYIFNFYQRVLIFSNKAKKVVLLKLSLSLSVLLFSLVLILMTNGFEGRVYGQMLAYVPLTLLIIYSVFNSGRKFYDKKYWSFSLKIGLPLIPHNLSHNLLLQFDRIMINSMIGSYFAGLYGFAYSVGMIVNIINIALNNAWVPWFYDKLSKEKFQSIRNGTKRVAGLFSILASIIILFSKEIVMILGSKKYTGVESLVIIIAFSYFLTYFYYIYSNFSIFHKKTGRISIATILAAVINVLLNYILIPQFGYVAAAFTTLTSYGVLLLFHWINVVFFINERRLPLKIFAVYFIVVGICAVLASIIFITVENYFISMLMRILLEVPIVSFLYSTSVKGEVDERNSL